MSGSVVESRDNYGGGYGTAISNAPASNGGGEGISSNKMRSYMIIVILIAGVELVLIGILLFMVFGGEEKVCTYEDVLKTIEEEDSPSENWKLLDDVMFDVQEDSLSIYAEAMTNKGLSDDSFNVLKSWANEYVDKFGGEAIDENAILKSLDAHMTGNYDAKYWELLVDLGGKCARFDLSEDFLFLKKYDLATGSCDELDY